MNPLVANRRPIVTKVEGEWRYNCGKFEGERANLKGNPPYMDYFEWAVGAGAIPTSLLREAPELMEYYRHVKQRRTYRHRGGNRWYSDELDSGVGDISGQAAMMEDW